MTMVLPEPDPRVVQFSQTRERDERCVGCSAPAGGHHASGCLEMGFAQRVANMVVARTHD